MRTTSKSVFKIAPSITTQQNRAIYNLIAKCATTHFVNVKGANSFKLHHSTPKYRVSFRCHSSASIYIKKCILLVLMLYPVCPPAYLSSAFLATKSLGIPILPNGNFRIVNLRIRSCLHSDCNCISRQIVIVDRFLVKYFGVDRRWILTKSRRRRIVAVVGLNYYHFGVLRHFLTTISLENEIQ